MTGLMLPLFCPGSSNVPKRWFFAQPIVEISRQTPRWDAMPMPDGWHMPWPSKRNRSGMMGSLKNAFSTRGPSLKAKSPGI
jgi:hypothetical protein